MRLPEVVPSEWSISLPRLIRLFEKKRGDRRTGSNLVGSVGEAMFFGALFLLGTAALAALITAHVVRPSTAWYAVGLGFWCMVLVLGSFAVMGGVGVLRTALRIGFSAERRCAFARRANEIDLVREAVPHPQDFPTLPGHEGLTNSPGTELAYRLPSASSAGWRLLATTVFALLWNAVGCVLLVLAINGWLSGQVQWLLSSLLIPHLAIGGGSVYFVLRQIWIDAGMGPTSLEICSHPLLPGREYQVHLSQSGQLAVKSLSLWLECQEEATYHQGTDIRHEVRTVYEQQVYERNNFQIEPGIPFHTTCSVPIAPGAMLSFQWEHNAVHWRLLVRGSLVRWPKFERRFPIIVYPGEATMRVVEPAEDAASASGNVPRPMQRRPLLRRVTA